MSRRAPALVCLAAVPLLVSMDCERPAPPATDVELAGLSAPVKVFYDAEGVPHLYARTDTDLTRVQGYLHARDRFWKMDITRREVDGTMAELLGPGRLDDDVQMRVIGLHRAAARSLAEATPREIEILEAYADGVNAWVAEVRAGEAPLPPEYVDVEISGAGLRAWTALDTLAIGKGIAASLSLDIDAGLLEKLEEYCAEGAAATPPFDGAALLFQDVSRGAPMDPSSTVPDATNTRPYTETEPTPITCAQLPAEAGLASRAAGAPAEAEPAGPVPLAARLAMARRVRERAQEVPFLAEAMQRREREIGSNEWGVSAAVASPGQPIIANDPHLSLGNPSEFYENHLVVAEDPATGPMNVSGVTFPGVPFVILGQNERITWGATTNPMDVADLFADRLVRGRAGCPVSFCIETGGALYPVEVTPATYLVNTPDDGVQDNLAPSGLGLTDLGSLILTVPFRSFGPIVDIDDIGIFFGNAITETGVLVLQYTGFHATGELRTFRNWNRARNLAEFRAGLDEFDAGSQNWAYADSEGNLGYFSSSELPLRADLESGTPVGLPPFFVRDGVSGVHNWIPDPARSQGQTIPFAILPYAEMPQTLNPPNHFFVNANNDPAGTALDNDPLNQRRLSDPDAIYYLNGGYSDGLRSGRITRLVRALVESGEPIDPVDLAEIQTNTQQLDAELMVPFLLDAFASAQADGAPAELAAYAADTGLADAIGRLEAWDFSTPTGLPEGWDASDVLGERLEEVPAAEVEASIAATIYNVWRGKLVRAVIDARLSALGLSGVGSSEALVGLHHLLSREPFTGVGASGVDFFPEPAGLAAEARRDAKLLETLRATLDALAGPAYAAAFGESSDPNDWRWGRLHRITFRHELGGSFSLPPDAGFQDLSPELRGLSRDGGYEVVNASGFGARADGPNSFTFSGGPVRRYVGQSGFPAGENRVVGYDAVPSVVDGLDGDLQLRFWLTGDQHVVRMDRQEVEATATRIEDFAPPAPPP